MGTLGGEIQGDDWWIPGDVWARRKNCKSMGLITSAIADKALFTIKKQKRMGTLKEGLLSNQNSKNMHNQLKD